MPVAKEITLFDYVEIRSVGPNIQIRVHVTDGPFKPITFVSDDILPGHIGETRYKKRTEDYDITLIRDNADNITAIFTEEYEV